MDHKPDESWMLPDAADLGKAAVLAENMARATRETAVIVATIWRGEIGFNIHTQASYAALREMKAHNDVAPLCSVTPHGEWTTYEAVRGLPVGNPTDRPQPGDARFLLDLAEHFTGTTVRTSSPFATEVCDNASERLRRIARLITPRIER